MVTSLLCPILWHLAMACRSFCNAERSAVLWHLNSYLRGQMQLDNKTYREVYMLERIQGAW